MTGFKLRTSGIGSDRSTNWATTTTQWRIMFQLEMFLRYFTLEMRTRCAKEILSSSLGFKIRLKGEEGFNSSKVCCFKHREVSVCLTLPDESAFLKLRLLIMDIHASLFYVASGKIIRIFWCHARRAYSTNLFNSVTRG